jgi:hypothetical protein
MVARFFLVQYTITGKMYNRPNVHEIYQHFPLRDPPKFTQVAIFGLKIYHLATPVAFDVKKFTIQLRLCCEEMLQTPEEESEGSFLMKARQKLVPKYAQGTNRARRQH